MLPQKGTLQGEDTSEFTGFETKAHLLLSRYGNNFQNLFLQNSYDVERI